MLEGFKPWVSQDDLGSGDIAAHNPNLASYTHKINSLVIYLLLTSFTQHSLNSSLQQLLHLMLSRQAGFSCPCSLLLSCQLLPQQCNLQDRTLKVFLIVQKQIQRRRICPGVTGAKLISFCCNGTMHKARLLPSQCWTICRGWAGACSGFGCATIR